MNPQRSERPQGSVRKRSRRACEPCRRRKRKCDGQQPCRSCQEWEYTCTYNDNEPTAETPSAQDLGSTQAALSDARPAILPSVPIADDNFYEPNKKRFYDASSAVSFPRALAVSLEAGVAPRIHSFAYNVGIVQEQFLQEPFQRLRSFLTAEAAEHYVQKYLQTINTLFPVVEDIDIRALWQADVTLQFETMACWVILLGSLFSWPTLSVRHQEILEHAQALLDRSNFHDAPARVFIEHIQAWILRTIYLRCTTRPNITWISSSIMMHVTESMGVHREMSTLGLLNLDVPHMSPSQQTLRRKVFWLAWTLNRMVSFEIGRNPTMVGEITTKVAMDTAVFTAYRMLYPGAGHTITDQPEEILSLLSQADDSDHLVALVRADIACGLYREIHKSNPHVNEATGRNLIKLVERGLEVCRQLLSESEPWWMLTSMPFQFICVAVAVGKSYILEVIPQAVRILEDVFQQFQTHMAREACETAQKILRIATENRDKELSALHNALAATTQGGDRLSSMVEEQDWALYFGTQMGS